MSARSPIADQILYRSETARCAKTGSRSRLTDYTAAPRLSKFGAIFELFQLSRAGAHRNGETWKSGAPAPNGTQGANEGKTCACGCRSKKGKCHAQTRIGRGAGA